MRHATLRVDGEEVPIGNDAALTIRWDDQPGFVEAKLTSEGVIVDEFNDDGECTGTWAHTYDEITEMMNG